MRAGWKFLVAAMAAACVPGGADAATDITFYIVSDPHYGKPGADFATRRTAIVPELNALPGTPYPAAVGGGPIGAPRGVLVAGDLVERPDSALWREYVRDYGVAGEGRLRWPVFDALGNHDEPPNQLVVAPFKARNRSRRDVYTDTSGYFYSWDWDQVHFVNLNLYAGNDRAGGAGNPLRALDFLRQDLAARVGTDGRPVVVMQHYQFDDGESWWSSTHKAMTRDVLKGYNVVALVHGHSHAKNLYLWQGMDVLDAGTAMNGDLLVVRIKETRMFVVNRVQGNWGQLRLDKTIRLGVPRTTSRKEEAGPPPGEQVFGVAGRPGLIRVEGDYARVEVLDAFGRAVRVLLSAPSGRPSQWDRRDEHGRVVPPGLYFLHFTGSPGPTVRPLVLP